MVGNIGISRQHLVNLDSLIILRHTGGMASFMSAINLDLDAGAAPRFDQCTAGVSPHARGAICRAIDGSRGGRQA
jgi:hypothetical protein